MDNLYELQYALEQAQDYINDAVDNAEQLEEEVERLEEEVERLEEEVERLEDKVDKYEEKIDILLVENVDMAILQQKNILIKMILEIENLELIKKLQDLIDNNNIKSYELEFEETEE